MAIHPSIVIFLTFISYTLAHFCDIIPGQGCQIGKTCTSGTLVPGLYLCPSDMVCCMQKPYVNECTTGTHKCSPYATCINNVGSYTCVCNLGYYGNGYQCSVSDINECAANTHNCPVNSVCTNKPGSYTCTCVTGYQFNGATCADIDECATGSHVCGAASLCMNNDGSYKCVCGPGYYQTGSTCTEYPCGVVGPLRRVFGGNDAARCSWPWQLSVRRNPSRTSPPNLVSSVHECGGILLSPYWFLTTPECILYSAKYNAASDPRVEAFVVAGDYNVNIDEGAEQILMIDRIFIHPDYPSVNTYEELTDFFGRFSNTSKQANAFAMVKLSTPAVYNDCVKHICLPSQTENLCEEQCAVTGWGYDDSYSYTSILQEANITVFPVASCKAFSDVLPQKLSEPPQKTICSVDTKVWPCLGDDGSPISCKEGNRYVLRAMYSYPDNCGQKVKGLNFLFLGDVSKAVSWIKQIMMSN